MFLVIVGWATVVAVTGALTHSKGRGRALVIASVLRPVGIR